MDERELLKRSLKGEEEAFTRLVEQNRAAVFRHCLSIVHDEAMAEDLTQETFVHAFQHLSSFQMKAKFSTWLWRIAHNLALSYLKKHPPVELEFKEELIHAKKPEAAELDESSLIGLQEAIAHLDPKHRIVLEMYDLKRIPQKEIAAQLGIPYGTVRSRLFNARRKVRKFLQGA